MYVVATGKWQLHFDSERIIVFGFCWSQKVLAHCGNVAMLINCHKLTGALLLSHHWASAGRLSWFAGGLPGPAWLSGQSAQQKAGSNTPAGPQQTDRSFQPLIRCYRHTEGRHLVACSLFLTIVLRSHSRGFCWSWRHCFGSGST